MFSQGHSYLGSDNAPGKVLVRYSVFCVIAGERNCYIRSVSSAQFLEKKDPLGSPIGLVS